MLFWSGLQNIDEYFSFHFCSIFLQLSNFNICVCLLAYDIFWLSSVLAHLTLYKHFQEDVNLGGAFKTPNSYKGILIKTSSDECRPLAPHNQLHRVGRFSSWSWKVTSSKRKETLIFQLYCHAGIAKHGKGSKSRRIILKVFM